MVREQKLIKGFTKTMSFRHNNFFENAFYSDMIVGFQLADEKIS